MRILHKTSIFQTNNIGYDKDPSGQFKLADFICSGSAALECSMPCTALRICLDLPIPHCCKFPPWEHLHCTIQVLVHTASVSKPIIPTHFLMLGCHTDCKLTLTFHACSAQANKLLKHKLHRGGTWRVWGFFIQDSLVLAELSWILNDFKWSLLAILVRHPIPHVP